MYETATKNTKKFKTSILIVMEDSTGNYYYLTEKVNSCGLVPIQTISPLKKGETQILNAQNHNRNKTQAHLIVEFAINRVKAHNQFHESEPKIKQDAKKEFEKEFSLTNSLVLIQEVFCVVDVDHNAITPWAKKAKTTSMEKAYEYIKVAQQENSDIQFHLIVSHECFEVWYLLHFFMPTRSLYTKKSPKKSEILPDNSNNIEFLQKQYLQHNTKKYQYYFEEINDRGGSEKDAIDRAKKLAKSSSKNEPCDNPSTDLYILIERLNEFKAL